MSQLWIRLLFVVCAAYDFCLGLAFLVSGPQLFEQYKVPAPNHWGYIHFCCLMLMIFGLMFLAVAIRPRANRNLIPYGALLKLSYVAVTGYYWFSEGIPWVFKPFLFMDAAMLAGLVWAWLTLGRPVKA
jgi:hypothetical protein